MLKLNMEIRMPQQPATANYAAAVSQFLISGELTNQPPSVGLTCPVQARLATRGKKQISLRL